MGKVARSLLKPFASRPLQQQPGLHLLAGKPTAAHKSRLFIPTHARRRLIVSVFLLGVVMLLALLAHQATRREVTSVREQHTPVANTTIVSDGHDPSSTNSGLQGAIQAAQAQLTPATPSATPVTNVQTASSGGNGAFFDP